MRHAGYVTGAILLLWSGFAVAAESTLPLAISGLVVSPSAGATIQFDSADIQIDPSNVNAKYKITNPGISPVPVTLGIQVSDLDFSDPDSSYAIPAADPLNFIGLTVKIDGKQSSFAFSQSALLEGRDITGVLRANKLALVPIGTFQNDILAMLPDSRQKLQDNRVIVENGADAQGNPVFSPTWTLRTSATRRITLAPGQTISVDLRYRTSVGFSLDTPLRQPLRNDKALAALVQMHKTDYCVDDGFLSGLDKILIQPAAPAAEANTAKLRERSISFVMQPKTLQGPYKDFRLVVDKGRVDRVVSFCLNNLKRISPTAFEMRVPDYQPEGELKVLLIGRN